MIGLDPAGGSLVVARAKPGTDRVRWIHGDATSLPPMQVDPSHSTTEIDGVGKVESCVEATVIDRPLVSFRWTWVFDAIGEVLVDTLGIGTHLSGTWSGRSIPSDDLIGLPTVASPCHRTRRCLTTG